MAKRDDITIDWDVSPRIITVESPSVIITMQDLYDTLRYFEIIQIDEDFIVSGSGKETLGESKFVGLTITLNNALLAFEARPGPTTVLCRVTGGNMVAVDSVGDPVDTPISPTEYTQIILENSTSASLIQTGISGLTTEEALQLAAIFESTDKKLLTKALYLALK